MPRTLNITHRTEYRYSGPVSFEPHRLMVRPRDGHDLRLLEASLLIEPAAKLRWSFDPFGNSVALASFETPSDVLVIESNLSLVRYPMEAVLSDINADATPYPFAYDVDELLDLAPYMAAGVPGDGPNVKLWLERTIPLRPPLALDLLRLVGENIHASFSYSRRDELGTQTAGETLESGGGTCRDFAFLFIEAARNFGFAARFVTGYLHDPAVDSSGVAMEGGGATHAWAEVYLPDDGWVEFDPTNRIVAGGALVKIAATRTPQQASPISGAFNSDSETFVGMDVSVLVTDQEQSPETDAGPT